MKTMLHASAVFTAIWAVCPVPAQNLSGTVTAADNGTPLAGVTVNAVMKPVSVSQMPVIYQSLVDSSGNYAISAPPGQYLLCARPQPQSLYLDPCQWGSPVTATAGAAAVPVPLSLQKGVRFIVRVHDPNQLLLQVESALGTAISASVTSPSIKQFPLPMVYADGLVRDYGTVVPTNVPMSATVASAALVLGDTTGAALVPTPITFQALTTDVGVTAGPPSALSSRFPPPDVKMIHVYVTALR